MPGDDGWRLGSKVRSEHLDIYCQVVASSDSGAKMNIGRPIRMRSQ